MPQKLKGLKVDRVDLVKVGANPDAHIRLYKSATAEADATDVEKATFDEIRDSRLMGEMLNEVCEYTWDLQSAVYSSLYTDANPADEIMQSINQFKAAVNDALATWLDGKPVNKEAVEKMLADLSTLKQSVKEARVSKTATATPPAEEVPIVKAEDMATLPEPVRKALEAQNALIAKQAEDIAKQAAELKTANDAAATEKTKRELNEHITKATAEFKHLPEKADAIGALLQKMGVVLTKDENELVTRLFKAGDAALAQLSKATGEETSEETMAGDDPVAVLRAKAEELRKSNPSLTESVAFTKACEANPDVFAEYRKSKKRTR